jgi:hypothetical protein
VQQSTSDPCMHASQTTRIRIYPPTHVYRFHSPHTTATLDPSNMSIRQAVRNTSGYTSHIWLMMHPLEAYLYQISDRGKYA